MQAIENLKHTIPYLPASVRQAVQSLPTEVQIQIQEIRLRCRRPVGITIAGREQFLSKQGMTDDPEQALTASRDELAKAFQAVCSYSVYSHERDIANGFVTIRGGCRVGFCGTAVMQGNAIQTLRHISSLNFRIAGEYCGIAEGIWQQTGKCGSILIAGKAGSGKTTMLRDLCRIVSASYRTAVVDERGEIAATFHGEPQHDVGMHTDILDGYPRAEGILTALRVLAPEYIFCDEISTMEDAQAILQAYGCGVQFAAACHAGAGEDLRKRRVLQELLKAGVFQYCVMLGGETPVIRRLAQI